jgi:hypothetical protein
MNLQLAAKQRVSIIVVFEMFHPQQIFSLWSQLISPGFSRKSNIRN